MSFFAQYGLFFLKTITLVVAILITVAGIIAISSKDKGSKKIKVKALNKRFRDTKETMLSEILDKKAFKKYKKSQDKKEDKKDKPNLFVLNFDGDIKASNVESLREEISAVLTVATPKDSVLVKVESGGGTVNSYGLGASQLQRIRNQNIPLTVCVDKVAASGGYLMACVANEVIAAPFAIIGSIGVVAQLPNFHRWLKKHNVDVELLTAGEYKRTLTVFGENTSKGRQKFNEDLDAIHHQFKDHIQEFRHQVTIDKVATGEHWLAKEAYELKLVDKLMTSDEYINDKVQSHNVYSIHYKTKKGFINKMLKPAAKFFNQFFVKSYP